MNEKLQDIDPKLGHAAPLNRRYLGLKVASLALAGKVDVHVQFCFFCGLNEIFQTAIVDASGKRDSVDRH